jgi:hypothetical protein
MEEPFDSVECEASADDSRAAVIESFRHNFGDVLDVPDDKKDEVVEEMLEFAMESGFCRNGSVNHDPNLAMLHSKSIYRWFWKGCHGKKLFARFFILSEMFPWIKDLYGGYTIAGFARALCQKGNPDQRYKRITKQAVDKEVQSALGQLNEMGIKLPLPRDLRSPESREKMKLAAIENHKRKSEYSKFVNHESV